MLYRKESFCSFFFLSIYFGRNIKTGFLSLLSKFTTMQRTSTSPVWHLNPPEPVKFNLNDGEGL